MGQAPRENIYTTLHFKSFNFAMNPHSNHFKSAPGAPRLIYSLRKHLNDLERLDGYGTGLG